MPNDLQPFAAFLDGFLQVAEATKAEETDVRREAAARIAALEKTRVRAYRRHHFVRLLGDATRRSSDVATSLATQKKDAIERFGWSDEALTPAQQDVVTALEPVTTIIAATIFAAAETGGGGGVAADPIGRAEPGDLVAALDAFEAWYGARFGESVWALFDRFTPDLPVTDF